MDIYLAFGFSLSQTATKDASKDPKQTPRKRYESIILFSNQGHNLRHGFVFLASIFLQLFIMVFSCWTQMMLMWQGLLRRRAS